MYNFVVDHFSGWRIYPFKQRPDSATPRRVGYYLWHFPVLSETFIQREIRALQNAGLALQVFADAPEDVELLDVEAQSLMQGTCYLLPANPKQLARYRRRFFFKNPIRYLNLFCFTLAHRYGGHKNLREDVRVFQSAVYLAGCAQDQKIDHLHSPWANVSAFITLVASRLAEVPYSVQARASADLYRTSARYALTEKFENAKFILTNSHFNRSFIELYLNPQARVPIYPIYEGLDPAQFTPRQMKQRSASPIQILSVARLIEEKGLVYLLQALKLLKDSGCSFCCEIIGAPVEAGDASYDKELEALWTKLALQDCVAFLGALPFDQVLRKYERADIFVLPCVPAKNGGRDVTPNALIEAMAMELAVISTNMSGIPEIVEHGVSGLLVPPKNHRAVAQALTQLIADPTLCHRLGQNARARVEERFNIAKNILPVLELFQALPQ